MSPRGRGQAPLPTPDAASTTTGASLIGGGAWRLASMLVPQGTNVVLSIAIARMLGPPDFGRQSFIAFAALSTMTLLSAGLGDALMRYGAEFLGRGEGPTVRRLVAWTAWIQLAGAAVGGGALALVGVLGAEPAAAWQLAGLATALAIMQGVPNAALMGAQRFREASVIGLITNLIAVPSTIAVVASGGGVIGIFAVEAAVAAANLGWTVVVARRALPRVASESDTSAEEWRAPFLRFAAFTTVEALLALIVWRRSEFFFLNAYSTDTQIGFYSIAFAGVTALSLIPQTLAFTVSPAFATLLGAGDWARIRVGYGRTLRLLTLGTLPLAAGAIALGPAAIELAYGKNYSEAGTVLLVMLAVLPLLPLYSASASLLTGLGRALAPMVLTAIAAAVNLGLDFLFIPRWDAIGAAAASTAAQVVVMGPIVVHAMRLTGGVRLHANELVRAALASAAGGASAWAIWSALGGAAGLLLGLLAGAAVFALLAAIFRILPAEDAEWLEGAAGARLGGLVGRGCRILASASTASVSS